MAASVLIALREPLVRLGVEAVLRGEAGFAVVGYVDQLDGILSAVTQHRPDVLILDSHFQQGDDELMASIMGEHADCRVLVMVDHTDEECTIRSLLSGPKDRWPDRETMSHLKECCLVAFRASARGCLPKGSSPDRLVSALRAITAGEVWAGPGLSQYLVDLVRPATSPVRRASRLTKREIEVVGLLAEGLSNREIAGRLGLSEQTVKNHIARVMQKVDVRNRVELVLYAVRERLA